MSSIQDRILSCLSTLKGSGKFLSSHTAGFVFPGLNIDGIGEVAFPVNEAQAKALIAVAQKAPFGKGSETLVDDSVRNTWEIDAAALRFENPQWATFLRKAIDKIKPDLGLEDYEISAHLYKLLIYEKGSFFLPHRDSEKEKGMFGTLVVELPSKHTGGELIVSFGGKTETVSFADNDPYVLGYAAFYADCEHEIKPVMSGYRVSLVYNLIQSGAGKGIAPASIDRHAAELAEILRAHQAEHTEPAIILLGHQYTPENFSASSLKLDDRSKAEALLQAAKGCGYYAKLCLVTSYQAGAPDMNGYLDYDDGDVEDADMEEVLDESLSIEHWADSGVPSFSNISFKEADLITSFPLNEDEPIVKESTGYQGNYGPDLMHWYHYGAVMIWSRETNARLLIQQDPGSKLEWLKYLFQNRSSVADIELTAAWFILSVGFEIKSLDKTPDLDIVADWIIQAGEPDFLLNIPQIAAQFYFRHFSAAKWTSLIDLLGPDRSAAIFARAVQNGSPEIIEQLIAILSTLQESNTAGPFLNEQIARLPGYLSEASANSPKRLTAEGLKNLIVLDAKSPQAPAWVDNMVQALIPIVTRDYLHAVLAPLLMKTRGRPQLSKALFSWCMDFVQRLVANKPAPPQDWRMEVPVTKYNQKIWGELRAFLESPELQVFQYRKVQKERDEMERAIRDVRIDLKTETIKVGSPHTLRITKTRDSFKHMVMGWEEDVELLERFRETAERRTIG